MLVLHGHAGPVRALAYAPGDALTLASAADDRTVRLWNPAAVRNWSTFRDHQHGVFLLAFSPDGGRLVSGGRDRFLCLYDVALERRQARLQMYGGGHTAVAFAPDGQAVVAGHRYEKLFLRSGGVLLFWDVADPEARASHVRRPGGINDLAFSPDGQTLAVAESNHIVRLWPWGTGERPRRTSRRFRGSVRRVAFAPAADVPLLAVATGRTVELWDAGLAEKRAVLKGHRRDVRALAFSPDGRLLLSGGVDRTVRLWDVRTGQERAAFNWGLGAVHAVAFAPDGMTAAAGGDKPHIVVWDVDDRAA